MNAAPTLDPLPAEAFLTRLFGNAPGLISLAQMPAKGTFKTAGHHATPAQAAAQVAALEAAGAKGIYHRVTTLASAPPPGERGNAEASRSLTGFWADADYDTIGHKHDPAKHEGRTLPPDAGAAWEFVTASGLLPPTLWVHSGGGLYPWWLLDEPAIIDDANRHQLQDLSTRWQRVLQASARARGWEYGAGLGDLARVLRVPGTTNRKAGQERPCRVVQDDGPSYTLQDLRDSLRAAERATHASSAPRPAPAATPRPRPRPVSLPGDRPSAFDTLDAHVTFDDILTGAGWVLHRGTHGPAVNQCWSRPGDPENPCSAHTLTDQPNVLVVFSEAAGLPTGGGQKLTRGRLFAHLHHRGDERAAALDLYAAMNGRDSTYAAATLPLPRSTHPVTAPNLGTLGERDVKLAYDRRADDQHQVDDTEPLDVQDPQDSHEAEVARQVEWLRVQQEARRAFALEQAKGTDWEDLYLDATELDQLPTHEPLIDKILSRHSYGVLRGRDHTFKSFIALDWAFCLATGKPWQGHAVDTTRVLYVAGEGAYGIDVRKKAWEQAWRTRIEPGAFTLRRQAVNLYAGGAPLEELLSRITEGGYGLVVIDTLRRASGQAKENTSEMGVIIDNLERIREATLDGSVLVVAHTDKNDTDTRGFSAIEDDADIVWRVRRDEERHPLAVDLTNTKMKNGPDGLKLALTMSPTGDSLIVGNTGRGVSPIAEENNYDTDNQLMTVMRETFAQTGASVGQLAEVTELGRSTVYKSRGRLLDSGQLITRRRGATDYLYLPNAGVESTVESTPRFHTDSTPPAETHSTPFHAATARDSTPVHTDSTGQFHTIPHPAPCLEDRGGVDRAVDTDEIDPDECPTCHAYTCNRDHGQEGSGQ